MHSLQGRLRVCCREQLAAKAMSGVLNSACADPPKRSCKTRSISNGRPQHCLRKPYLLERHHADHPSKMVAQPIASESSASKGMKFQGASAFGQPGSSTRPFSSSATQVPAKAQLAFRPVANVIPTAVEQQRQMLSSDIAHDAESELFWNQLLDQGSHLKPYICHAKYIMHLLAGPTDTEKAWRAPEFERGHIPDCAPPERWCFD